MKLSHKPVWKIIFPKHDVRYKPWGSWYWMSSSVGHHSSVSGTASDWKGVSACEMMSLRRYLRPSGTGEVKLGIWSSRVRLDFSAGCFPLRFLDRGSEGEGCPVLTVIEVDDRQPFCALWRALWNVASLKSPKELPPSVQILMLLIVLATSNQNKRGIVFTGSLRKLWIGNRKTCRRLRWFGQYGDPLMAVLAASNGTARLEWCISELCFYAAVQSCDVAADRGKHWFWGGRHDGTEGCSGWVDCPGIFGCYI